MSSTEDLLQAAHEHHRAGRLHEAQQLLERVLEVDPRHAQATHRLGLIAFQLGLQDNALELLRAATQYDPSNAAYQADLGEICRAIGKLSEAKAACTEALRLNPHSPAVLGCLGLCHYAYSELAEAERCFRDAVTLDPQNPARYEDLAMVLHAMRRLPEAQATMEAAVRLAPEIGNLWHNLGVCLSDQGKLSEAIGAYDRALERRPDLGDARLNSGMAQLALGDFANGWEGFDARLTHRRHPLPRWDGAPLASGRLLVSAEEGLGDMLQFVRFVPLLAARGVEPVVEVPDPLLSLFRQSGYANLVPKGAAPDDCRQHIPMLSVPRVLGITLDLIPTEIPYLATSADAVEKWRARLAGRPGLRVGIQWQGSRANARDSTRSIPLRHFAPLAEIAGVQLVSLQKNAGREQLAEVAASWPIVDVADDLVDFLETAAVMRNLDLVIGCDSALAHLAGGLGVRAWVALPAVCDWRWMLGRSDSPWYPSLRLFRQQAPGDWQSVFAEIAAALATRLAED